MRTLAVLFTVLLNATGCDDGAMSHATNQEVTATASRLRVRHLSRDDLVFGNLTINGSSQTLLTADLECFSLHVGANKSDSIWVDSYVDIARGDYPARDGTVSVAVYWAMKDFKTATDADLQNATLSIDKPFLGPCFKFADADKRP